MAEIADDHMSVIADEMAYGEGSDFPCASKKTSNDRMPTKKDVDWAMYFKRNREGLAASIKARADLRAQDNKDRNNS